MPGVVEEQSRHFIAQLSVTQGSRLVGLTAIGGIFPALKDITVLMVQRGEHAAVPPYEALVLEAGDLVIVAAHRQALAHLAKRAPDLLHPHPPSAASHATPRAPAQT